MIRGVADTHAVIWYVFADLRLSATAKAFIATAAGAGDQVAVSAMTNAEIVYLREKGRVSPTTLQGMQIVLDAPDSDLLLVPFDRPIAETLPQIERAKVPDLPDRIIAATALHLGVPLISKDARIQTAGLTTIW